MGASKNFQFWSFCVRKVFLNTFEFIKREENDENRLFYVMKCQYCTYFLCQTPSQPLLTNSSSSSLPFSNRCFFFFFYFLFFFVFFSVLHFAQNFLPRLLLSIITPNFANKFLPSIYVCCLSCIRCFFLIYIY